MPRSAEALPFVPRFVAAAPARVRSPATTHLEIAPSRAVATCALGRLTLGAQTSISCLRPTQRAVAVRPRPGCVGSLRLVEQCAICSQLPPSPPLLPHPLPCSLARGATSSECSLPLPLMISSRAPCTPNCARTILRAPSSFPVSRLKAPARPPYRAPHLIAAVADGSLADAPMHRRSVVASPMMHRRSVVASPMMQCVCLLGDAPMRRP